MIEIFGNETCVWCMRAKRTAEQYQLKYVWLDTDDQAIHNELRLRKTTAKTIPQIWWDGRYVGGYEDFLTEIQNTMGGYGDGNL
jgi:glutaredoxin